MSRWPLILMTFSLSGSSRISTSVVVSATTVTCRVSASKVSGFSALVVIFQGRRRPSYHDERTSLSSERGRGHESAARVLQRRQRQIASGASWCENGVDERARTCYNHDWENGCDSSRSPGAWMYQHPCAFLS